MQEIRRRALEYLFDWCRWQRNIQHEEFLTYFIYCEPFEQTRYLVHIEITAKLQDHPMTSDSLPELDSQLPCLDERWRSHATFRRAGAMTWSKEWPVAEKAKHLADKACCLNLSIISLHRTRTWKGKQEEGKGGVGWEDSLILTVAGMACMLLMLL